MFIMKMIDVLEKAGIKDTFFNLELNEVWGSVFEYGIDIFTMCELDNSIQEEVSDIEQLFKDSGYPEGFGFNDFLFIKLISYLCLKE